MTIKLLEACPYITYERYDKDIYWGLYTSDSPGNACPVFLTNSRDDELYEKLKAHFLALFENGFEQLTLNNYTNTIVTVDLHGPWLNQPLCANLLGAE